MTTIHTHVGCGCTPDQSARIAELEGAVEAANHSLDLIEADYLRMSERLRRIEEALEPEAVARYIAGLSWSPRRPDERVRWDEAYTLIVGNIRGFASAIARTALNPLEEEGS